MATLLPKDSIIVGENPTARTTLLPFGYQQMLAIRRRRRLARLGPSVVQWVRKIGIGEGKPVVLSIGDGSLTYSAAGFLVYGSL